MPDFVVETHHDFHDENIYNVAFTNNILPNLFKANKLPGF